MNYFKRIGLYVCERRVHTERAFKTQNLHVIPLLCISEHRGLSSQQGQNCDPQPGGGINASKTSGTEASTSGSRFHPAPLRNLQEVNNCSRFTDEGTK